MDPKTDSGELRKESIVMYNADAVITSVARCAI
jgi:hypothetical protein